MTIKLAQTQSYAGSFRHAMRATSLSEGGLKVRLLTIKNPLQKFLERVIGKNLFSKKFSLKENPFIKVFEEGYGEKAFFKKFLPENPPSKVFEGLYIPLRQHSSKAPSGRELSP